MWRTHSCGRRLEFLHFGIHDDMMISVSGHGFSRAVVTRKKLWASAPVVLDRKQQDLKPRDAQILSNTRYTGANRAARSSTV